MRSKVLGVAAAAVAGSAVLAQSPPTPKSEGPAKVVAKPLDRMRQWGHWRGPLHTGVAPHADPPTTWSEKKNVRWKVAVPGRGHSSPVVYGDRIYLTTAVPFGPKVAPVPDSAPGAHDNARVDRKLDFLVLAYDRRTGAQVFKTSVLRGLPPAGAHKSASLASNSPVTDGEHVYASFGSVGIFCLNRAGKIVWRTDLGDKQVKHGHGEGSSPVLHGDTLAVNWDHQGPSFIVALDKRTGKPRWRQDRDEVTSWASPIVYPFAGRDQLIVSGTRRIRGYDLATGAVIWECGGLANNVVASPVAGDGVVVAGSSYVRRAMLAIRLEGAKGDVTETDRVLWRRTRRTPYVPSPLLYGRWVYCLNHYQNVLSRVDFKTGAEPHGPFRVPGAWEIYASPVGAKDRIYVTDRAGLTVVISHADGMPRILAENKLDDAFNATAAIVGREIFLRGERHLYCLAEPQK